MKPYKRFFKTKEEVTSTSIGLERGKFPDQHITKPKKKKKKSGSNK